jgi:hypothetical protein
VGSLDRWRQWIESTFDASCCSRCDAGRGPLLVVWDQRDPFHGEDEPPVAFDWPCPSARATAVDALGQAPLRRRPPAAPSIAAGG